MVEIDETELQRLEDLHERVTDAEPTPEDITTAWRIGCRDAMPDLIAELREAWSVTGFLGNGVRKLEAALDSSADANTRLTRERDAAQTRIAALGHRGNRMATEAADREAYIVGLKTERDDALHIADERIAECSQLRERLAWVESKAPAAGLHPDDVAVAQIAARITPQEHSGRNAMETSRWLLAEARRQREGGGDAPGDS